MTIADYEKELKASSVRARERWARGELQFDGDTKLRQEFEKLVQEHVSSQLDWSDADDKKPS